MRTLTVSEVIMEIIQRPNSSTDGKKLEVVQSIDLRDGPLNKITLPDNPEPVFPKKADPSNPIVID